MIRSTLYFIEGDGETRVFEYKDDSGNPIDVTGYGAEFLTTNLDTDLSLSVGSGITVDGPSGAFTVIVTHSQTDALKGSSEGFYGLYRLRVTPPSGEPITLSRGALVVL